MTTAKPAVALRNPGELDSLIEPIVRAARIPGAAIAVVTGDGVIFAKGYGYRDLNTKLAMTAQTIYPIASTTKAITATLVGMLVDDGHLSWDTPIQRYLPAFRLKDPIVSMQATLRDILSMRTGLPRHDWLWAGNRLNRAELLQRAAHVDFSAGLREKFQYNNVLVTIAGNLIETALDESWEALLRRRVLEPLGMNRTVFTAPATGDVTSSYHENIHRELVPAQRLAAEVTGPSGGSIHSNVEDMARWVLFNLTDGAVAGRPLIKPETLDVIRSAQMVGPELSRLVPNLAYAMGWFVDQYNGHARVSHGGDLHDVNSDVSLFPDDGIGMVCFINFGCLNLAKFINQGVFDLLVGLSPAQTLQQRLALYEKNILENQARLAAVPRIENTRPSHALQDYVGCYGHPGYGTVEIRDSGGGVLTLVLHQIELTLQHWHYDCWVAQENERFWIHQPHVFDRSNRILFETNEDGAIAAVSLRLEPAVSPIRFEKQPNSVGR